MNAVEAFKDLKNGHTIYVSNQEDHSVPLSLSPSVDPSIRWFVLIYYSDGRKRRLNADVVKTYLQALEDVGMYFH